MEKQSTDDSNELKATFPSSSCIKILKDHQHGVKCLLELNNKSIASGSYDTSIKIWNEITYECITTLNGHNQVVMCLIQLADSSLVSAAGELIKIWDITHFTCKTTLIGHTNTIYTLIHINDTTIASGGVDKSIKLWDIPAYRYKSKLSENNEWVRAMITFNNDYIISGSDTFIHVWEINTLIYQRKLLSHSKPVSGLSQIDSNTLASCSFDCSIIIWDMISYNVKAKIDNLRSSVTCITLLNENYLISGLDYKTIQIFDINTNKCVDTIDQHNETITSLIKIKNRQDNIILVSGSIDGTIRLWAIDMKRTY